jgi:hypothetical protein
MAELTALSVKELLLNFADDDETAITDNRISLAQARMFDLVFTVTFDFMPSVPQLEMTVAIQHKGDRHASSAGEFFVRHDGTTITEVVDVDSTTSSPSVRLTVPAEHDGNRWHDDPGPYDATVALTPVGDDVRADRGPSAIVRYDFWGE